MGGYEMFHAIPQRVFCITGKGGCFGVMTISPRRLKVMGKCLKLQGIHSMAVGRNLTDVKVASGYYASCFHPGNVFFYCLTHDKFKV